MAVLAVSAASTLSLYTSVSWNVEAGRHVFGDETTVRPEKKVYAYRHVMRSGTWVSTKRRRLSMWRTKHDGDCQTRRQSAR